LADLPGLKNHIGLEFKSERMWFVECDSDNIW